MKIGSEPDLSRHVSRGAAGWMTPGVRESSEPPSPIPPPPSPACQACAVTHAQWQVCPVLGVQTQPRAFPGYLGRFKATRGSALTLEWRQGMVKPSGARRWSPFFWGGLPSPKRGEESQPDGFGEAAGGDGGWHGRVSLQERLVRTQGIQE